MKLHAFMNSKVIAPLLMNDTPELWIFGYGSLIWHPGFKYDISTKGSLAGYSRRFYQGNTTYRGTEDKPGRVVTLIENSDDDDQTFGMLFKVSGWEMIMECLEHLYMREIESGYSFRVVTVKDIHSNNSVQALTVIALKNNMYYLGESDSDKSIAVEIARAHGHGGPNREYLIKLADSMRKHFPNVVDQHLFQLEKLVLSMN